MKMIANARAALRHYSTQALAAAAGIPTIWEALPDDMKAAWPPTTVHWVLRIMGVIAAVGLVGKFVSQTEPPK